MKSSFKGENKRHLALTRFLLLPFTFSFLHTYYMYVYLYTIVKFYYTIYLYNNRNIIYLTYLIVWSVCHKTYINAICLLNLYISMRFLSWYNNLKQHEQNNNQCFLKNEKPTQKSYYFPLVELPFMAYHQCRSDHLCQFFEYLYE